MRLPRCGRAAFRTALFSGIALFLAGLACNAWVILAGCPRLCHSLGLLAPHPVGLVLGTAPILGSGRPNPFFEGRMDAAAALYHAGKVRHWLLSGDNGRRSYDEPAAMRAALLARKVPATALTVDAAGFRTLDSMARARHVFGLRRVVIVTDDFHQARALFLAQGSGLDATGYASVPVPFWISKKTRCREWGSRVKAVLDLYALDTRPRFLGPRILVPGGE
jgi:SanA protein